MDADFGRFDAEEAGLAGDIRASFLNPTMGHKVHHLYLWYLADKMGVLQNVLNVLSSEVASDGDNIHATTQNVQHPQRSKLTQDDEHKKKEHRAFRIAVGSSLTAIAITSKEEALRRKEDKVERFTVKSMEAEEDGNDRKQKYYEGLAEHHSRRVAEYMEEIEDMKKNMLFKRKKRNLNDDNWDNWLMPNSIPYTFRNKTVSDSV